MAEKLKSLNLSKLEKQTIFLTLAITMSVIVLGFAVYAVLSLASDLNSAVAVPTPTPSAVKFDIQGFQDLKLIH